MLVTVIGGYLGAGKTTLLNHLITTSSEPVAVLVNDFGSLNVDESLVESRDGEVVSLANGCICCSLTDGFVAALETISALDPRPDRLVIETSGVGDLHQVANYAGLPGFRLDGIVCVVDAESVRARSRDRWVGDLVRAQVAAADLLVLNKADLVDGPALGAARALLEQLAPDVMVVRAVRGVVPLELLLGVPAGPAAGGTAAGDQVHDGGHPHAHQVADGTFTSWTWATDEPVPRAEIEAAIAALPASVVRAKGLVQTVEAPDRALVVQVVGQRRELRDGGPWTGGSSTLVLIALAEELEVGEVPERLAPSSFPRPG